jgi:hypothetical protein
MIIHQEADPLLAPPAGGRYHLVMDEKSFDEQVAALRGKVVPKCRSRLKKSEATPEEWAARLDHTAAWKAANSERHKELDRRAAARYRAADPERRRRQGRAAAARHQASGKKREYERRRLSVDANFRLSKAIRCRLRYAVSGGKRAGSAVRDLGCTVDAMRLHVESEFQPGMNWGNYGHGPGTWSIDHIYPLSKADLTDRPQLLAACNWRNLQPLWFEDNVRKGDEVSESARERFEVLANFLEVTR